MHNNKEEKSTRFDVTRPQPTTTRHGTTSLLMRCRKTSTGAVHEYTHVYTAIVKTRHS